MKTTFRRLALAVALTALAFVTVGCGGSPSSPSAVVTPPPASNQPPAPGATASLSSLSPEARAFVEKSMSASIIQRMTGAVKVYPGPYSPAMVSQALSLWEKVTPLRFEMVASESEAGIVIANEMPGAGTSEDACGSAAVHTNPPAIVGGRVRIAIGLKPGCLDQGNVLYGMIIHEVGHILGFGHSDKWLDVMSPSGSTLDLAPSTAEAVTWVYLAPLGAKVVQ